METALAVPTQTLAGGREGSRSTPSVGVPSLNRDKVGMLTEAAALPASSLLTPARLPKGTLMTLDITMEVTESEAVRG